MKEDNQTDSYNVELDEVTEKILKIYLFKNVQNIEEIHKKVTSKELPCCIVKANLIADPFQIAIAANKAAINEKYKQMVTRSLYTEIIYCLSTSKNISQSLTTFGISNDSKNILLILVYNEQEKGLSEQVLDSIKGEKIPINKLSEYSDLSLIKKIYKIDEGELKISNLLDSVVSRISDKILK